MSTSFERDQLARDIIRVSRECAESYRRSAHSMDIMNGAARESAANCAAAASNTGWFILKALGYSDQEIERAKQ